MSWLGDCCKYFFENYVHSPAPLLHSAILQFYSVPLGSFPSPLLYSVQYSKSKFSVQPIPALKKEKKNIKNYTPKNLMAKTIKLTRTPS